MNSKHTLQKAERTKKKKKKEKLPNLFGEKKTLGMREANT